MYIKLYSALLEYEERFSVGEGLIFCLSFIPISSPDRLNPVGNLLVIAFVSYFGAKLHRPKIIAVGCVLMSFGTFLIAMPHFINDR